MVHLYYLISQIKNHARNTLQLVRLKELVSYYSHYKGNQGIRDYVNRHPSFISHYTSILLNHILCINPHSLRSMKGRIPRYLVNDPLIDLNWCILQLDVIVLYVAQYNSNPFCLKNLRKIQGMVQPFLFKDFVFLPREFVIIKFFLGIPYLHVTYFTYISSVTTPNILNH